MDVQYLYKRTHTCHHPTAPTNGNPLLAIKRTIEAIVPLEGELGRREVYYPEPVEPGERGPGGRIILDPGPGESGADPIGANVPVGATVQPTIIPTQGTGFPEVGEILDLATKIFISTQTEGRGGVLDQEVLPVVGEVIDQIFQPPPVMPPPVCCWVFRAGG